MQSMEMEFKSGVSLVLLSLFLLTTAQLYEGDTCILPSQELGKCVHLSSCNSAIEEVKDREHPEKCGFKGLDLVPIVCCPESNNLLRASISEQKCRNYPESKPQRSPLLIIGGTPSSGGEFPHMATLGFADGDKMHWLCGGSLISEQFVMTAAHCLYSAQYGAVSWARLGDLNLISSTDDARPQDYRIIQRIAHPNYSGPATYNDIALVKLATVVTYNYYVKPVCLYANPGIEASSRLVASGWGLTDVRNTSDHLQKVTLDLFTYQECAVHYNSVLNKRRLRDGILPEQQFCAGGKISAKDTCKGDSGGPLQVFNEVDRKYQVVGITSFGIACGVTNIPSVYIRVSYFLPWLESVVWPN